MAVLIALDLVQVNLLPRSSPGTPRSETSRRLCRSHLACVTVVATADTQDNALAMCSRPIGPFAWVALLRRLRRRDDVPALAAAAMPRLDAAARVFARFHVRGYPPDAAGPALGARAALEQPLCWSRRSAHRRIRVPVAIAGCSELRPARYRVATARSPPALARWGRVIGPDVARRSPLGRAEASCCVCAGVRLTRAICRSYRTHYGGPPVVPRGLSCRREGERRGRALAGHDASCPSTSASSCSRGSRRRGAVPAVPLGARPQCGVLCDAVSRFPGGPYAGPSSARTASRSAEREVLYLPHLSGTLAQRLSAASRRGPALNRRRWNGASQRLSEAAVA